VTDDDDDGKSLSDGEVDDIDEGDRSRSTKSKGRRDEEEDVGEESNHNSVDEREMEPISDGHEQPRKIDDDLGNRFVS
jgi:hypothetical protein